MHMTRRHAVMTALLVGLATISAAVAAQPGTVRVRVQTELGDIDTCELLFCRHVWRAWRVRVGGVGRDDAFFAPRDARYAFRGAEGFERDPNGDRAAWRKCGRRKSRV